MKILYGIQGTGNGHITRARAMAVELKKAGLDVDYLVSGRPRDKLFDMEPFGDFQHREGLTFVVRNGRIQPLNTLLKSSPLRFVRDIKTLELGSYDLVISDFEPITAWASRLKKVPVIGLGHQYAFRYPIPRHRGSPGQHWLMKYFAPAPRFLGLHWHHFDQPVLPPIAPVDQRADPVRKRQILVYLPFESAGAIRDLLRNFADHSFSVYHPEVTEDTVQDREASQICWHRPCRDGFQANLHRCEGVICNAGFELASESLQLGKKLLVKPVAGQTEQYSNALALDLLGYGHTMKKLDEAQVGRWLTGACGTRVLYPNVAAAICAWLRDGAVGDVGSLAQSLWEQTVFPDLTAVTRTDSECSAAVPDKIASARSPAHGRANSCR